MENWGKHLSDEAQSGRPVTASDQLRQDRVEHFVEK
jgi:hypothetical protein